MILIYGALIIIAYSIYWIVQMINGKTGPQVHEENKRLRAEAERMKEEITKLRNKK
jgi:cell division protein FtsB